MKIIPWKKEGLEGETAELSRTFSELQREVNCLFESFFGETSRDLPSRTTGYTTGFAPSVDVTETETHLVIKADLPGMSEKDIEVTIEEDALVLKGEKREEKEERNKGVYRIERSYGSFFRRIPLPVEIESENIEATFNKGVLKVMLPKHLDKQRIGTKVHVKTA